MLLLESMGSYADDPDNMLKLITRVNTTRGKAAFQFTDQVKASSLLRRSSIHGPRITIHPASTQAKLPPLPVPPLQVTLDKFLQSARPLLSEKEFAITQDVVKKFSSPGGTGEKLQRLLEERAKKTENWLAEWWLNVAYLEYRIPVVVHSSPGLVFPIQTYNTQEEQLKLAAKVILAAVDFRRLIDENKLPLEKMGKDPLDMSQYKKIIGTCRIPAIPRDSLSYADCSNPPKHVTVAYKNHFFEVVVYDGNFKPLSEEQVMQQLKEVVSSVSAGACPVGILTSEHRDVWSKAYKELASESANSCTLESIHKSMFLLCLDEANPDLGAPNRQTVSALQMVHGCGTKANGANRWFDKTVQLIVGTRGELGLTYEHSPAEGPPIASLMDHIMKVIDAGGVKNNPVASVPKPALLPFTIPSSLQPAINKAGENLDKLVDDLEMYGFTYKGYGKDFPKSQKMSPDSYIQMALQYAFYRLHKVPAAHYESASTRKYIHGRTETIRSCSCESVEFAKAMLDKNKSPDEKVQALKAAVNSHKKYTLEAVNGFGVDRHLTGLKLTALENGIEVPAFYKDVGYVRSSHMRLSTSQVAAKCDAFMCYGPLVQDGYACCYNPREHEMVMGVSSFRSCPETNTVKFKEALEESFDDMKDVLLKAQKSKL